MKIYKIIFYFLILICSTSIVKASQNYCDELKKNILNNDFNTFPMKNKIEGFGIGFYYDYDEENGEWFYDSEFSEGKGITIHRMFNDTTNEVFDQYDTILSIDNVELEEIFSNNNNQDATMLIDDLLDKKNIKIEFLRYEDDQLETIDLFKQFYDEPLDIWVGYSIDDITRINIKEGTYDAKYNFTYEWKDNRSINKLTDAEGMSCIYKNIKEEDEFFQNLWKPEIVEDNKIKNIDGLDEFIRANIELYIYEDGNAYTRIVHYNNATFNTLFDLSEFPFDTQYLDFHLRLVDVHSNMYMENLNDEETHNYFLAYYVHPEWKYKSVTEEILQHYYTDDTYYDYFVLSIKAEREFRYYLIKVISPIILILIICWSVFWISGIHLESRLTVTSVSLLALIAYNYVVDEDLPKLGYQTILDSMILLSYLFAGTATVLTIYSYNYCSKNKKEFSPVDTSARFVGPAAYLLLIFFLIAIGINSMSTNEFLSRVIN